MITVTNLTGAHASGSNFTSYTTNSISPAANSLVLVSIQSVNNGSGGSTVVPTVSGASMTWTQVQFIGFGSSTHGCVSIFRAFTGATPGSGALTVSFGSQSTAESNYSIDQFFGVAAGGTNGSGAIAQNATGTTASSNTLFNATLSTLANAQSVTYGAEGGNADVPPTKGASFTTLSSTTQEFMAEYAVDVPVVAFTSPNAGSSHAIVAVEVLAGSGGALFFNQI